MSVKNLFNSTTKTLKKHSPAILTGAGIIGLGATAYLAYKAKPKVEVIVENIEAEQARGNEIDKVQVARDLAEALYLPITVGVLSAGSILMSHRIQRKRIIALSSALAAQQARNAYFENKYRKQYGDEEYQKFVTPTEQEEREIVDGKGKVKKETVDVKGDLDKSLGQWYSDSSEYAADDHTYNLAYIESVNERLQTILFQRGSLLLNEVREALGFERIRTGMLLGWTTSDNFDITKVVTNCGDVEAGEAREQIWVTWTTPRYIYEEVDFNGRYSPF